MTTRREFITLLGGAAAAWPLAARAQQALQVPRVGFVYPGSKTAATSRIEAILSGLRVSGFPAPAQIELVVRTAEGDPAQITPLLTEVMASVVNVFIANGPALLRAARSAMLQAHCKMPANETEHHIFSCRGDLQELSALANRKWHRSKGGPG